MSPEVLGIPIEGGTKGEVLAWITATPTSRWIVTANPENLLMASEQPVYADALRAADRRTIDGVGLWLVLRLRGRAAKRLTGVDLAEALLREASERGWRVALFGGEVHVAADAAKLWKQRLPRLQIQAWSGGRVRDDGSEDGKTWEDREAMLAWMPDVVLCAFGGGGTKQEFWIAKHRASFVDVRVTVGVGGAFDMWTGRLRRAPWILRTLGFEWLWRWVLEPARARRMWRATVGFLLAVWRVPVRSR